jgi:hypothetical protein
MPLFKDKTGRSRFAMNPQVGRSMFGKDYREVPGLSELSRGAGRDLEGETNRDYMELHHGGHPGGSPAMDETHNFHTIHKSADGEDDIRNHADYDDAEAHMRECIAEGGNVPSKAEALNDQGDYDDVHGGESSAVFA